ncbi:guanylate kinase [Paramuribaculum intestinale]|jgi:guanylate kinase|uniref:guanylate kinase n=1 Tax=Paramuribaculum intestinale TaxID=2094151 RepID=UPI0025B6A5D7|nr:guanylate kinase [Paramuribaculum intestinale]
MEGKIIIVSAPSGCGKSTIINRLLQKGEIDMEFSVSATNRQPREGEVHGVSYWFLTDEEFRQAIADDNFVEYEEVYPGRFYGTLKSEVERRCREGHNVVLDIDVKGGVNVKRMYGERALALFIEPPSIDALRVRLEGRGTESPEAISQRLGKAEYELSFAPSYDIRIVNDDLDKAVADTEKAIKQFVGT